MNAHLVHRLNTLFDSELCLPNVRVGVVSGLGQGFCAGSDIGELAAMTPVMRRSFEAECARLSQSIRACSLPVVVVVHGFAIGGGLTLAAACDFVITTPEAKWSLPEVSIGRFPAWGLEAVVDRIGCSSARRLTWGVDRLDGLAASRAGAADSVADDPQSEAKALAMPRSTWHYRRRRGVAVRHRYPRSRLTISEFGRGTSRGIQKFRLR